MDNKETFSSLTTEEVNISREKYGSNILPKPPRSPWYEILWDKFKDPLIRILLVAAAISGVIGYFFEGSIIETVGIVVAILIVVLIAFYIDVSSQAKFDALEALNDKQDIVVKRDGVFKEIPQTELVVGDLIKLTQGESVPADAIILKHTNLTVDQSSLTGESMPVDKVECRKDGSLNKSNDAFKDDHIYKSTIITTGNCLARVTTVGEHTEIGKVNREATLDLGEETPLTKQLNKLSDLISKAAFIISGLLFVMLSVHYFISGNADGKDWIFILKDLLKFVMIAITLVVVAVPEGLPMAVILSLSYSMRQLIKDNNLIKKLHACETMGCISAIVTDKTGTLTKNVMVVESTYDCGETEMFDDSLIINNSAIYNGTEVIGNPTDSAILKHMIGLGVTSIDIPSTIIPFDSQRKFMVTSGTHSNCWFIKGAVEAIVPYIKDLTEYSNMLAWVDNKAAKGHRVIVSAVSMNNSKELTLDNLTKDFIFLGAVSISDPIREDVPDAIKECKNAGIRVVMATGDNINTAKSIGAEAGISPMYVHPRCTPTDKVEITKQLKSKGNVVAVIGDGVNDAPAMNNADVGVSVGDGTQIAKEASDVVLLDNSFVSIVKGIKFGRSLYRNIQKFIVFQSTINVTAAVIVFGGQFVGIDVPLTVTQMLWINLIMDTLAALALSTTTNEDVMSDKPRPVSEFIITPMMKNDIIYKSIAYCGLLFYMLPSSPHDIVGLSKFFTLFVLIQWWNLFSCRVFGSKLQGPMSGLMDSKLFVFVSILILIAQYFISAFGGEVFRMEGITLVSFIQIWLIASLPFLIFEIIKYIQKIK